jgi:hypothetical protein
MGEGHALTSDNMRLGSRKAETGSCVIILKSEFTMHRIVFEFGAR